MTINFFPNFIRIFVNSKNDLFEVNATIMNGKNGLWVQWPSIKQQNFKWKKIFIIKDKITNPQCLESLFLKEKLNFF